MKIPIYYRDASELARLIKTREISPVEVMKVHLDRIAAVDLAVNAIVTAADRAMEAAKQV